MKGLWIEVYDEGGSYFVWDGLRSLSSRDYSEFVAIRQQVIAQILGWA